MANAFNTVQKLAKLSALYLDKVLGAANRIERSVEQEFAEGTGDTVDITKTTALGDAGEYSHPTITTTDIEETKVPLVLTNHYYKAAQLTTKNRRLDIKDMARQVVFPLVQSIARTIDKQVILGMASDFARNVVGTAGTSPSTVAHVTAAVKALKDGDVPQIPFNSIIGTSAWANFFGQAQFQSSDYGPDRAANLKAGAIAPISGVREWFDTQLAGLAHVQGDIAGTVLVDGATQTGSILHVDALTAATGTIKKGTRFTVAGIAGVVFTTTADATIASNEVDLPIYPALPSSPADDAAVTFQTAFKQDIIFHPGSYAAAVVAPTPLKSAQSAVVQHNGLSIRVSWLVNGLQEQIVADTLFGQKVLNVEGGIIVQG